MENGRITNSFQHNVAVRYLNSERDRDVHMEQSPPEIKSTKRYTFLWN